VPFARTNEIGKKEKNEKKDERLTLEGQRASLMKNSEAAETGSYVIRRKIKTISLPQKYGGPKGDLEGIKRGRLDGCVKSVGTCRTEGQCNWGGERHTTEGFVLGGGVGEGGRGGACSRAGDDCRKRTTGSGRG